MPIRANGKIRDRVSLIEEDQVPIAVHVESILPLGRHSHTIDALWPRGALNTLWALGPLDALGATGNAKKQMKRHP